MPSKLEWLFIVGFVLVIVLGVAWAVAPYLS